MATAFLCSHKQKNSCFKLDHFLTFISQPRAFLLIKLDYTLTRSDLSMEVSMYVFVPVAKEMKAIKVIAKNAGDQNLVMIELSRGIFITKKFALVLLIFVTVTTGFLINREPCMSIYEGKQVEEILERMPKKDKARLEYFFREYINLDGMGYVIFGNKPMAISGVEKKLSPFKSFSSFLFAISPRRIQFENGFKTWKKYEKIFPMKRFAFRYEENESFITCTFINKHAFIEQVQKHADDFKNILKRNVSGEDLLKESEHKDLFTELLQDHDLLTGILYGFGRNNASLFHQSAQLNPEEQTIFLKNHSEDPWEKEWEEFDKNYEKISWFSMYITGNHLKSTNFIILPGFRAALNNPETIQLKEHYLQTRQKMIDFYKDKDFLTATLQELTR